MKITKVELWHINIPLKKPFYPAWIPGYPQTHNRFTLLRLSTDDGFTGLAAGVAFGDERGGLGGLLAPYLLGLDPTDIELGHQRIIEGSFLGWRNFWMEAAFYDIQAQMQGIPVWKLLGGQNKSIPVYWSTGEVCRPKDHSEIIKTAHEEGYHAVKLRIHAKTLQEDVNVINQTRLLVNPSIRLGVDANQGWRVTIVERTPAWSLQRAKDFIDQVEKSNIEWLEEPLEMHMYEELAELRHFSKKTKIAGAELNAGWHEARMFLHFGSYDLYQPDCTVFGIFDTLKVINACNNDPQLSYSPHTWTNGVGQWINMHLFALSDYTHPLEFPYEPGSWEPRYRDGILTEPIMPNDGFLELPDGPGLAIPIDWEKVKKFGRKFFSMTEGDLTKKVIKEKGIFTALKLKKRKDQEKA
ncbi:MAG: mandelate racemase/muconate lactonizing enzyme family protein [Candidatus Lokiarchaeota archaeon]|nr:mandelate racemase/muconate lactonizing enzyme family protein [Candidatus Lokiarchaeota archaeon]